MAHVRKVIVAIALMLVATSLVWSAQATAPSYLHVAHGDDVEFFQFDERGVYLPQTEVPVALKEGYIVLSGQDPVTIRGPFATIVLQRESILTIGTTVPATHRSIWWPVRLRSLWIRRSAGMFEVYTR
jgi:hypothetical protein